MGGGGGEEGRGWKLDEEESGIQGMGEEWRECRIDICPVDQCLCRGRQDRRDSDQHHLRQFYKQDDGVTENVSESLENQD